MKSPLRVFIALLLGTFLGYACERSSIPLLHDVPRLIDPFARLFINAILVCVIPLVTTSLIAGCASTNPAKLGRLAGRSLTIILSYLVAAAGFAGAIAFPLFRYLSHVIGRGFAGAAAPSSIPAGAVPTFGSFLVSLFPANIFKAAQDGALLPLVLFSVALGIAIAYLPVSECDLLSRFFRALADGFTVLIGGILKTVPIGVFCLSVGLGASVGISGASWLMSYVGAMCFICATFILIIVFPHLSERALQRWQLLLLRAPRSPLCRLHTRRRRTAVLISQMMSPLFSSPLLHRSFTYRAAWNKLSGSAFWRPFTECIFPLHN